MAVMSPMPPEHRALLGLLSLGLVGQLVRLLLPQPEGVAPGALRLVGVHDSAAIVAHRDSLLHAVGALKPGQRIDVNRATAVDLTRLPGVGPGLARRIVAGRQAAGAFAGFASLDSVEGVGPALIGRLAPHVTFSGAIQDLPGDTLRKKRKAGRSTRAGIMSAPPLAMPRSAPSASPAPPGILSGGPAPAVLNQGSVADIDRLPGIGRVRAQRIVSFRDSAGPFQTVQDLARVPGISLAFARRLWTAAGQR